MFPDQRERPLLQAQLRAFLYDNFRPLRVASVGGKYRHVGIDAQGVVAPVASDDHTAIKIKDPGKLITVEAGD